MTTSAIEQVGNVKIDYAAVLNTLKLNPKDPNVQALILVCQQYELDPVLKHMILIQGAPYVTHKGLWHIAHRSGLLDGHDIIEEAETDREYQAKVAIYRKDWSRPVTMRGRYPKSGTNKQYGQEMAVTRAECLVLRRLFDVALPVYEEINWTDRPARADEDRGAPQQQPAQAALPPANMDPVTAEILPESPVREPQNSTKPRTFAPPTGRARDKALMDQINAQPTLAEASEQVRNVEATLALKERIAAMTAWHKETLGDAWKAAGLPSIAGTGKTLDDEQLLLATELVAGVEAEVAEQAS